MDEGQSDARMTPPTEADATEFMPHEPPAWPRVVGIVSIVLSCLGLGCGGCSIVFVVLFLPKMLEQAEQQLGAMPDVMKQPPSQMILAGVGFIFTFVLLAAGIATTMRKPVGRLLHLISSSGSLVFTVINTVIGVQHLLAQQAWAAQNASSQWAKQANSPFAYFGIAIGVFLGAAWPLFCLVWFGPMKKKPDEGFDPTATV